MGAQTVANPQAHNQKKIYHGDTEGTERKRRRSTFEFTPMNWIYRII